ncbi:hypothetical protein MRX96_029121 [Rhipicephalus microplus]
MSGWCEAHKELTSSPDHKEGPVKINRVTELRRGRTIRSACARSRSDRCRSFTPHAGCLTHVAVDDDESEAPSAEQGEAAVVPREDNPRKGVCGTLGERKGEGCLPSRLSCLRCPHRTLSRS